MGRHFPLPCLTTGRVKSRLDSATVSTKVSSAILTQGAVDGVLPQRVGDVAGKCTADPIGGRPNLDVAPAVNVALRAVASSLLQGDPSFTSLVCKGAAKGAAECYHSIIVTYSYYIQSNSCTCMFTDFTAREPAACLDTHQSMLPLSGRM